MYPPVDMRVEVPSGAIASAALQSSFGAQTDHFQLLPGDTRTFEYDAFLEFLFPEAGEYEMWIDYDAQKQTATWGEGPETLSPVRARSNTVIIHVDQEHVTPPPDPAEAERFWRRVERMENARWWEFWNWF
jgi:hypothetical protein